MFESCFEPFESYFGAIVLYFESFESCLKAFESYFEPLEFE